MSQHDLDIANQGFAAFRADLNNALQALGSLSSGDTAPATPYANQLWYETDTNTLHIRNEANSAWLDLMVIDQSTGSPSFTGQTTFADGSASSPSISNIGDTNAGIFFPAADTVAFSTDGTERMRIDASGNLGLGVTPVVDQLGVSFQQGRARFAGGASDRADVSYNYYRTGGTNTYIGTDFATVYRQISGQHQWLTAPSGTAGSAISFTQAMTLNASGNLGVGTASPSLYTSYGLHINAPSSGNTGSELKFTKTGQANSSFIQHLSGSMSLGTEAGFMSFSTGVGGSSERVRIDASGNVGIGTASPTSNLAVRGVASDTWSGVADGLALNGLSTAAGVSTITTYLDNSAIRIGAGVTQKTGILIGGQSYSGAEGNSITFRVGNAERMRIDASGNLLVGTTSGLGRVNTSANGASQAGLNVYDTAGGSTAYVAVNFIRNGSGVGYISTTNVATAYVTASDYRLKENVQPMQNALDTVAQLNPVTYTWKADGSAGQGFIAHELQAVVPDCVTGEKDAVDADGNPQYQGVDTSFLVATLTKAIQEQQAIITALEARVAALEA